MCCGPQDIMTQIHKVFDPLAQKLGLLRCLERRSSETVFSIAFQADDIGLELNVDLADFFVYALLYKPSGDEIPVGYEDRTGGTQKIYVQEALKQLDIKVAETTRVLQKMGGDYHNCSEMLASIKDMVELHWSSLTAEKTRWFGGG